MNQNWARSEQIIWEELDGAALLVNPATGARWTLNATAAALWKLCDGRTSAEIARLLARSREEIAEFCAKFETLGLLTGARKLVPVPIDGATYRTCSTGPSFRPLGLGNGPRRRPGPSGISGPA